MGAMTASCAGAGALLACALVGCVVVQQPAAGTSFVQKIGLMRHSQNQQMMGQSMVEPAALPLALTKDFAPTALQEAVSTYERILADPSTQPEAAAVVRPIRDEAQSSLQVMGTVKALAENARGLMSSPDQTAFQGAKAELHDAKLGLLQMEASLAPLPYITEWWQSVGGKPKQHPGMGAINAPMQAAASPMMGAPQMGGGGLQQQQVSRPVPFSQGVDLAFTASTGEEEQPFAEAPPMQQPVAMPLGQPSPGVPLAVAWVDDPAAASAEAPQQVSQPMADDGFSSLDALKANLASRVSELKEKLHSQVRKDCSRNARRRPRLRSEIAFVCRRPPPREERYAADEHLVCE